MGQAETARQPKERRVKNFSEVSLGFSKTLTLNEARRCPQCAGPTCLRGCPLGIDIPGFVRILREGDAVSALVKIKQRNPLPGVCGRVCLAPCEPACIFDNEQSAIGIRALERYAADHGRAKFGAQVRSVGVPANGKTVAIIGSGPSGLAAAFELIHKGYGVTIFEAQAKPGGVLRYGIPEFRLPSKVLDAEIADLQALGIVIRTNVTIGPMMPFEDLTRDFHAVLLAVGTASPEPTVPGDHWIGVSYAQEFLMRLNLLGQANPKNPAPALGERVVVVGQSSAALDCARAALRFGKKASVVFPGLEEEFEVYPREIKDAIEEGVKLESLTHPLEIVGHQDRRVQGLRCERLDFSEDANGGWNVKPVPGSEFLLEADTVILAENMKASSAIRRYLPALVWTEEGTVRVNELTGFTSVKNVFAAGNVVTGGGTVVDAMAGGKKAAGKIADYLL